MRGGKRAGAGRPQINPENKRVQISLSVAPITKSRIATLRKDGVPVTAMIEDHVEDLMIQWLEGNL